MVFALIGVLFVIGVFVVFVVSIAKMAGAKQEMDALERGIAAGHVPELAAWSPGMLGWLSKDLVGGTTYYRPMGGARTYNLAVTVPSCEGPATLLALSAELTPREGRGRIDMIASSARLGLVLHGGMWHVSVNAQPFGAIDQVSGRLDDVRQVGVGWCRKGQGGSQLELRGAAVAWIEADATLQSLRPSRGRPLLRLASPVMDLEPLLWVLAAVAHQLGTTLMMHERVVMS